MLVEEYSKTIRHELLKVFWVMLSQRCSKMNKYFANKNYFSLY